MLVGFPESVGSEAFLAIELVVDAGPRHCHDVARVGCAFQVAVVKVEVAAHVDGFVGEGLLAGGYRVVAGDVNFNICGCDKLLIAGIVGHKGIDTNYRGASDGGSEAIDKICGICRKHAVVEFYKPLLVGFLVVAGEIFVRKRELVGHAAETEVVDPIGFFRRPKSDIFFKVDVLVIFHLAVGGEIGFAYLANKLLDKSIGLFLRVVDIFCTVVEIHNLPVGFPNHCVGKLHRNLFCRNLHIV